MRRPEGPIVNPTQSLLTIEEEKREETLHELFLYQGQDLDRIDVASKQIVTKVVVHSDVVAIPDQAFDGWNSLEEVEFQQPSKLETIGAGAFHQSKALTRLELPATITDIGGVKNLETVNCALEEVIFAPDAALETIHEDAFLNCTALREVTVPASVKLIGERAFSGNKSLTKVSFAPGSCLETIGALAFKNCTNLQEITVPSSVKSICKQAFCKATALKKVEFATGSKLQFTGEQSFFHCKALETLKVPPSVQFIGKEAFCENKKLQQVVTQPSGAIVMSQHSLSIRDGAFMSCDALETVHLGDNLDIVGANCFRDCVSLEEVKMGCQGKIFVGNRAFEGCNGIRSIDVPSATCIKVCFAIETQSQSDRNLQKYSSEFLYSAFAVDILEWMLIKSRSQTLLSLTSLKPVEFQLLVQKVKNSQKLVSLMSTLQTDRRVIFLFMLDAFMNIALFVVFSLAAYLFFESKKNQGLTFVSFGPVAYFALRELFQLLFEGRMYLCRFWNYFDLTRIALVVLSAYCMLVQDGGEDTYATTRHLLLCTEISVNFGVIIFLRNAFLPNAQFVGGLIAVVGKLWPFVFVSALMVFAFGFSFYALDLTSDDRCGPIEGEHCDLVNAVMINFSFMFGGPNLTSSRGFDLAFGFAVVIVLLNVLIAVVSTAWEESAGKGTDTFFRYRLAFLAEVESLFVRFKCRPKPKTRQLTKSSRGTLESFDSGFVEPSINEYLDSRTALDNISWNESPYSYAKNNPYVYMGATAVKSCKSRTDRLLKQRGVSFSDHDLEKLQNMGSLARDWELAPFKRWNGKHKLKITRARLVLYALAHLGSIVLGFFTFGLLWKRRFREYLFAIPFSPEEKKQCNTETKERLDAIEKDLKTLQVKLEIEAEKNRRAMEASFDAIISKIEAIKT